MKERVVVVTTSEMYEEANKKVKEWGKGKTIFEIQKVILIDGAPLGDIHNKHIDDYVVFSRDDEFEDIRKQLVHNYGIEENRIVDRSAIVFLPANANTGTIIFDSEIPQDCFVNINYLVRNGLIKYNNDFEGFFFESNHRAMTKWLHYFWIYERMFSKFKNLPIKMLEIGAYKGGSLQMWQHYFGEEAIIVGIDIDENCKQYEEGNIHIEIGSQDDRRFLKSVKEKYGEFDIILDDGGHTMNQQIVSFDELFPIVKNGGVYVCEDCHTSYWSRYAGGLRRKGTYIEFMKKRIDDLNFHHIGKFDYGKYGGLKRLVEHFPLPILRLMKMEWARYKPYVGINDQVLSIQFYDSIVAIEKNITGKPVSIEYKS